jgi:hypothetical protein
MRSSRRRAVATMCARRSSARLHGKLPCHYGISAISIYLPPLTSNFQLNTTTLGNALIPATNSPSDSTPSLGSIFRRASHNRRRSIGGDIGSELEGISGDIADKLAGKLGIKQWYSMHLMNMCKGTYTPSATASSAQLNVSSCMHLTAMCKSPFSYWRYSGY